MDQVLRLEIWNLKQGTKRPGVIHIPGCGGTVTPFALLVPPGLGLTDGIDTTDGWCTADRCVLAFYSVPLPGRPIEGFLGP